MDIFLWLQEVTLLIAVCEITLSNSDFLESFRPSEDNPPELNDFLVNVLQHKKDFSFVRKAARKYQKMKKDVRYLDEFDSLGSSLDYHNDFSDSYKCDNKRHVHHYNFNRKFRNPGFWPPKKQKSKFHRIRRGTKDAIIEKDKIVKRFPQIIMLQAEDDSIQKRVPSPENSGSSEPKIERHLPSQIFVEPQGESLQKRAPEDIAVQPDGETGKIYVNENDGKLHNKEKKQVLNLEEDAVHRTFKNPQKNRVNEMKSGRGDYYYVDLGEAAEREQEKYADKRRFWDQRRPFYYPQNSNGMYPRPYMERPRPENIDNLYHNRDGFHHNMHDEIAFEKALSYEFNPNSQENIENYNNPSGNNLYSVENGRPENMQPIYSDSVYPSRMENVDRYEYPPQQPDAITDERFFLNADNGVKRIDTTTSERTPSLLNAKEDARNVKHIGNGFIEITKAKRHNEEELRKSFNADYEDKENEQLIKDSDNNKQSAVLSKHSLHPLRMLQNEDLTEDDNSLQRSKRQTAENFKSRKLQFIDYEMTSSYNQEENYEDLPVRPKRDFLDALGMKNEEDYSEDNPYRDLITVNNTDVNNDTCIHNKTTPHQCTSTIKPSTACHQKDDVENIKGILEKELTTESGIRSQKREKRRFSELENVNNVDDNMGVREQRDTSKEVEDKIFENKDRIYSAHEGTSNKHSNKNHILIRQQPNFMNFEESQKTNNLKTSQKKHHKINKKEDCENSMTSNKKEDCEISITPETTTMPSNCSQPETEINSTYEQIAHQMDVENEKLAQVVNGHLASKIVSTVFDELKKKTSLKTKFYSGLSRKHVNFAGTIDFDIFKTNETEDADEARLLLGQITKVLNRLVLNQVRRKLCQRLPDELKDYLDIVLNVKNTISLENVNFVPNTQQGDYLFTYQENKNDTPFDLERLKNILEELENMLMAYHSMSEDCQSRAEPVKNYIEKHVKILKKIVSCPDHSCEDKLSEAKRDTPGYEKDLVERQLESVGLGKNQEFIPNFDLNQLVKTKLKNNAWKKDRKRDTVKFEDRKSEQYRKLQMAAERIREKRENEEKIVKMFGGKEKRSAKDLNVDYEQPVVYSLG